MHQMHHPHPRLDLATATVGATTGGLPAVSEPTGRFGALFAD